MKYALWTIAAGYAALLMVTGPSGLALIGLHIILMLGIIGLRSGD